MPQLIPRGIYYTVEDAAEFMELSGGRVRQLVLAEKIEAIRIGNRTLLIPEKEVKRVAKIERPKGRPASAGT